MVDGEALYVSASVGIACYPDHGDDYGTLFARADAAMYVAKAGGRNRYAVHDRAGSARRSKLKVESELHLAIERGELRLHYQPQVELRTESIVAAEALVRWQHPTLGLVRPGVFLGVAEESGLIVEVDRWVRHVLKVDRTFIEPFSHPDPDTRLVDGLVSMAHALDLEVVIEGVEDAAQAEAVRRVAPELAQGFHFHRPMPAEELTALLDGRAARMVPSGEVVPLRRGRARRARR